MHIGTMVWRIGDRLEVGEQLAWIREAGFTGVGFHASAGVPGHWSGIDPAACGSATRTRLRHELQGFAYRELHAPFAIELRAATLGPAMTALVPVMELAADLAVDVVTIHADFGTAQAPHAAQGASPRPPASGPMAQPNVSPSAAPAGAPRPTREPDTATASQDAAWRAAMQELDAWAARMGTRAVLETIDGFEQVQGWGLARVGVNLDVGHMFLPSGRPRLAAAGGLGLLIRSLGTSLFHLHLHDVKDETDHIELGTGTIPFADLAAALQDTGYGHGATLEMNPDRVTPDGIRRSAAYLEGILARAASGGATPAAPGPPPVTPVGGS